MLTFKADPHEYRYKGAKVPHITGLLTKYGLTDYDAVPPHILEEAKILGSIVHRVTELYDKNTLDFATIRPDALPFLTAWIRFLRESEFEITHIEPRLYSHRYGFAGTPDRIGIHKGKKTIIEIKTPKTWHRATGPQTAGQAILIREQLGIKIQKRYAIKLSEDGSFKVYPCTDRLDEPVFLASITLEKWEKNGRIDQ